MRALLNFYLKDSTITQYYLDKYCEISDNEDRLTYDLQNHKYVPSIFTKYKYKKTDETVADSSHNHCDRYIVVYDKVYAHSQENEARIDTRFHCQNNATKLCIYDSISPQYGFDTMNCDTQNKTSKYILFWNYDLFDQYITYHKGEFTLVTLGDDNKIVNVAEQDLENNKVNAMLYIRNFFLDSNALLILKYDLGNDKFLSKRNENE